MTDLLASLFIAFILSVLVASLSVYVIGRLENGREIEAGSRIAIWRLARLAALAPIVMALIFAAFPRVTDAFEAPAFVRSALPLPSVQVEPVAGMSVPEANIEEFATNAAGTGAPQSAAAMSLTNGTEAMEASSLSIPHWLTPMNTVLALYMAGLLIALGQFGLRRMALAGLIATSARPKRALQSIYEDWRGRLELESSVSRLVVVDAAITPFVTGWQPMIVLPRSLSGESQRQAAEIAVVHELVHVRRGDERDRFVGELLTVALWFNPALKTIEARLSHARELACDAEALQEIGGAGAETRLRSGHDRRGKGRASPGQLHVGFRS